MHGQEFNITDLNFERLNDNAYGVTFSTLSDDLMDTLVVPNEEWADKVCGLTEKAPIRGWHLVEIAQGPTAYVLLLGINGDMNEPWCTSYVAAVAPDRSSLLTHSGSLYRLQHQASGTPDVTLVLRLVYTLRCWGLGVIVKDWPEFMS